MNLGKAIKAASALAVVGMAANNGFCGEGGLLGAVRLQYAIFLAGYKPISGQASCNLNEHCALVAQDALGAELSILVTSRSAQASGKITIKCLKMECGFFNGAKVASFKNFETFFYPGVDILQLGGEEHSAIGRIFVNMVAQSGSE